jgi:hypothetical protein
MHKQRVVPEAQTSKKPIQRENRMKLHLPRLNQFACLLLLLTGSMAFAQNATIDCSGATPGAFTSIGQAVFNSPDHTAFMVSGNCTEEIIIQRRNDLGFFANTPVTIQAAAPTSGVVNISGSQNISFAGPFTITGGVGVGISDSSHILFFEVNVQNSGNFGVSSTNAQVQFLNGSISSSTRSGLVISGGTFELDGATVSNNGRIGVSAAATHLIISDENGLSTVVKNNGIAGVQISNSSQGDFVNLQIINNAGNNFGLQASSNTAVVMQGGSITGNTGIGVNCVSTTSCEFSQMQISGNSGGGIQTSTHAELDLDGGVQISGNTGVGILIDQASAFASGGGNTISNNSGDGLIVNALSALNFFAPDTITATAGNLALNCNNGSLVTGDVSSYKPKKCGAQFQAGPIH